MKIFNAVIFLIFIISCNESFSQLKFDHLLKIVNDENVGIRDAVVLIDGHDPMLTDENGEVFLTKFTEGQRRIIIKHLTYEALDTVILFPNYPLRFVLKLQNKEYILDELTVMPNLQITDRQVKDITDICLYEDHIVALFADRNKTTIRLFDSLGIFIGEEYNFQGDHSFSMMNRGHLPGSFYLIGSKVCLPFNFRLKPSFSISEQKEISQYEYRKTVGNVIYFDNKSLIKNEVSNSGNRIKLYHYNSKSLERKLLYEIFDREKEEAAIKNFNIIKSMYLRNIHNPNPKDIDFGFQKNNVLEDPNWNGDILDLYVNNEQNPYINLYKIATQGLKMGVKVRNNDIWIIDNVKQNIINSSLDFLRFLPYISLPESKTTFNFVQSDKLICIENGNEYFILDEQNKKWISIPVNDGKIYFPKRKILLGQYLYILGQKDNISPENTVVKFKVFE